MSEFASARPCKLGGKLAPVKRPQRKVDDGAELFGAPLSRNSSAAFSRWSARRLRSFPVCDTPLLLCVRRVLRTACPPKGCDVRRRIRWRVQVVFLQNLGVRATACVTSLCFSGSRCARSRPMRRFNSKRALAKSTTESSNSRNECLEQDSAL